jgi:hypothetical protein
MLTVDIAARCESAAKSVGQGAGTRLSLPRYVRTFPAKAQECQRAGQRLSCPRATAQVRRLHNLPEMTQRVRGEASQHGHVLLSFIYTSECIDPLFSTYN